MINAAGRALEGLGIQLVRADEERLIRRATTQTGLTDFGDDSFLEPLRLLIQSTEQGPRINLIGQLYARSTMVDRLSTRLQIEAAIAADPSILEERIQQPLFIIGLPRSGTTLLHRLLAVDPANRAPRLWEMVQPVPPPERETYTTDPRIAQTAKEIDLLNRLAPTFRSIHDLDVAQPEECLALMANDLMSLWFLVGMDLPEYRQWLHQQDLTDTYRRHKRQLQLLQSRFRGDRWVLKSPWHLHGLRWLLEVYPDARIVQTHRDPLKIIPSLASLMLTMREALQDDISPADVGQEVLEGIPDWLESAMRVRAAAEADPAGHAIFIDAHYGDIVADPMGTVRRTYQRFDIKLTDEAERRMLAYLDANQQHKHGEHLYTLEQFSLERDRTREIFSAYCERFGVGPE
jgi:hypothetical protein